VVDSKVQSRSAPLIWGVGRAADELDEELLRVVEEKRMTVMEWGKNDALERIAAVSGVI
jgi:hypothetical protein